MAKLQKDNKSHEGHAKHRPHALKYLYNLNIALAGNILRMELSVPSKELADIVETETFPLELTCNHCNTVYGFDKREIEDFLNTYSNK